MTTSILEQVDFGTGTNVRVYTGIAMPTDLAKTFAFPYIVLGK